MATAWQNWTSYTVASDSTSASISCDWGTSSTADISEPRDIPTTTYHVESYTTATSNNTLEVVYVWVDEANRMVEADVQLPDLPEPEVFRREYEGSWSTPEETEQSRKRREDKAAAKKKADETADELLLMLLDEDQQASYQNCKSFVMEAGGRRYKLKKGRAHNIEELDADGKKVASICCHIKDYLPDGDNLVAQKLALETDPEAFLAKANISRCG